MVDFFSGHTHCTRFSGLISEFLPITSSVIRGSAIGPDSFVVNTADLTPAKAGNLLAKYADDTYLIVPATNVDSRALELDNIESGLRLTNEHSAAPRPFKLCSHMGRESVLPLNHRRYLSSRCSALLSPTNCLSATTSPVSSASVLRLYALTILRAHGLCDVALQSVYRSVVIARLLYASSAWWEFYSSSDRQRIAAFVRRGVRSGFYPPDLPIPLTN